MSVAMNKAEPSPHDWLSMKLGDLLELAYGKGLIKAQRSENGKYPVYGSNGIVGYHNEYVVDGPRVIVGRKGAAGAVHLSSENCWPIDTTYFVKPKQDVDVKFIYYLLLSLRLKQYETSTAIPGLNRDDAYRLDVAVPELSKQKNIVAQIEMLFSELDKGIESLKTAREQLKVYRQAVLKHAFEGKLTAQWREENKDKLESPEQLLARIQHEREACYQQQLEEWKAAVKAWEAGGKEGKKPSKPKQPALVALEESTNSTFPDFWGWTKLGSVISYGPSNGWSPNAVNYETSTKAITLTATTSGKFDGSHFKYLDTYVPEKSELWIKAGDILVQRGNTIEYVGVSALYNGSDNQFIYPDLIMKIQAAPSMNRQYLVYVLSEHRSRSWLRENAVGAAGSMPKISQSTLVNMIIPVCSAEEQDEIVTLLDLKMSTADALDSEIHFQIEKIEILRQAILKKAFSGLLMERKGV